MYKVGDILFCIRTDDYLTIEIGRQYLIKNIYRSESRWSIEIQLEDISPEHSSRWLGSYFRIKFYENEVNKFLLTKSEIRTIKLNKLKENENKDI